MIYPNILKVLCAVLITVLSACSPVGPTYHPPSPKLPHQWSTTAEGIITDRDITRWWTLFNDPLLDSLVEKAALANQDLRIAIAHVREARAQRTIAASQVTINTSVSTTRSRRSNTATISGGTQNLFQVGFDADWELDIFGGTQRAAEAAEATLAAYQEDLHATLVSLEAEVVKNYIALRGNQRRLIVAQKNIATQEKTVDLVLGRYKMGIGSQLDLANAQTELALTKAQVPALKTSIKQALHQLAILLGQIPESLTDKLIETTGHPPFAVKIPINLPSELLRQRPDIRASERRLAAATAEIGVATAELFPRFSLAGLLGLQSTDLSNLVASGSRYWSIGPTLKLNLFDQGKARAGIEVSNARRDAAVAFYEKTVLVALAEVENALTAFSHEKETRMTLEQAVASGKKALTIAGGLYKSGLTDFLHVLQSEHALFQSEDQLAQSNQRLALDTVALYKALGGGWKTPAQVKPSPPTIVQPVKPQNISNSP